MALTEHDVAYVSQLARMRIPSDEFAHFQAQLSAILDYVALLQELDVSNIPPTTQGTELGTVMRPDEVQTGLSNDEALANAADRHEGMFRVPPVFEG